MFITDFIMDGVPSTISLRKMEQRRKRREKRREGRKGEKEGVYTRR